MPPHDEDDELPAPRVHALNAVENPGDIERVEEGDGAVRYTDVMLLAPGVWTDSESRMQVDYSAEGIKNSVDNWQDDTVNLLHDVDNEVSEVGRVDTESVYADDMGNLYGDVVLHRENAASEYADEAMRSALESGGAEGLGGPSVEIAADRLDDGATPPELVEATFSGLGLVSNPASKPVDFSRQAAQRAVALADGSDAGCFTLQEEDHDMDTTIDTDELRARLSDAGVDLDDDVDDETLQAAAESALELQEDEDGDDDPDDEEPDDESDSEDGGDDEPEEEEEGDDVDIDMSELAERQEALEQRLTSLEDELQQLQSADEELSELREDLAAAERVDDLAERLSELEDEPEDPNSLADAGADDAGRQGVEHTTSFSRHDPVGRSATR